MYCGSTATMQHDSEPSQHEQTYTDADGDWRMIPDLSGDKITLDPTTLDVDSEEIVSEPQSHSTMPASTQLPEDMLERTDQDIIGDIDLFLVHSMLTRLHITTHPQVRANTTRHRSRNRNPARARARTSSNLTPLTRLSPHSLLKAKQHSQQHIHHRKLKTKKTKTKTKKGKRTIKSGGGTSKQISAQQSPSRYLKREIRRMYKARPGVRRSWTVEGVLIRGRRARHGSEDGSGSEGDDEYETENQDEAMSVDDEMDDCEM